MMVQKKAFKVMAPLIYLSNFWRALKMLLINCEISPIQTCSTNCVISNQETTCATTGTVVIQSTQDNAKLLQQSKSGTGINIIQKQSH